MKKTSNAGKVAGVVSLAAGVVAAVATGYYFYGKGGKGHREELNDWTKKAKMDMLEKIKQMKDVTKEAYDKALAEILAKYKQVKNIDPKQLQTFGQELKAHWKEISKQAAKLSNKGQIKKTTAKI
jgi:TRAP-type mannitol/chloroaromatic compound transport system substrate-binding protein